jgi:lipopolysaccharide transport system permease protein
MQVTNKDANPLHPDSGPILEQREIPVLDIYPSHGWIPLNLRDLWEFRELLYFLAWRDIKIRYKQTILGIFWVVIQPLIAMVIFSIVFGQLAKLPSDGLPYPVFTYTALLPWTLFASGLQRSTTSLVTSSNLISKVYFPRLIIPTAAVLAPLVDFAVSSVILFAMLVFYRIIPGPAILMLPLFIALDLACALGVGLWFAALNVRYRDVSYILPFLVQVWLFATPVAYSISIVPEQWRTLYALNPMVGVIEGFRWALLGTETDIAPLVAVSVGVTTVLLISGLYYFRRVEKSFADVV